MKKIILLILVLLFSMTGKGADNYFQDGTTWEMLTSGTHAPSLYNYLTIELDGDTIVNGMSALKMYEISANEPRKLLSIIRTEGEKVYFQSYKESEDWTLLYDFGLKEGEGCYVGIIDTRWQIKQSPIITYVKCTAITTDEEHDGMEAMTMEEYEESTCVSFLGKGVWYTGLGSSKGVIGNSYFDAVGYSSWLIKAMCPASGLSYPKISSKGYDNYFQDSTTWEMIVSSTNTPTYTPIPYRIELDGDTTVNGMSALKMFETYDNEPRKLLSIIRTEGEKVYFQSYKESEDWTLLYDFGLKEGESCYVGIIDNRWQIKQSPITTYVKCVSITINEEYEGMETMIMEEFRTSEEEGYPATGIWLKGLGSPRGCTNNNYFDAVGGGSRLIKAVCPASGLSYPKETSSDGDIPFEEFTIEHTSVATNILNINTSENLTVYAIDGKILKHIPNPDNCETITFVNPGIYIIKNGNTLRKIIIR